MMVDIVELHFGVRLYDTVMAPFSFLFHEQMMSV